MRALPLATTDFALAMVFLNMSRGRWFPVPLFFLHGGLVIYNAYALLVGVNSAWIAVFINRAFELELAYILCCALFRISKLKEKGKGAP